MKPMLRALPAIILACAASGACGDTTETPTSPSSATTEATQFTMSTGFTASGSASRSFTNTAAGGVSLTLTAVTPGVPLGIGVGIPRANGAGCDLSDYVVTTAGGSPQLSITAEKGTFCIKVFDVGSVVETVTFTLQVTHS